MHGPPSSETHFRQKSFFGERGRILLPASFLLARVCGRNFNLRTIKEEESEGREQENLSAPVFIGRHTQNKKAKTRKVISHSHTLARLPRVKNYKQTAYSLATATGPDSKSRTLTGQLVRLIWMAQGAGTRNSNGRFLPGACLQQG